MKKASTLFALALVVLIVLLLVFMVVVMLNPPPVEPPPAPVRIPVGTSVEATGDRIVEIVRTGNSEQGRVEAVTKWLRDHSGYDIESIAPASYRGGADTNINVDSYLIVAQRKTERAE